jgi:DNA-binding transcriptional ArsR family regulator
MTLSDQDFREEFKPIQIPASYDINDSLKNRIIFALAALGEANGDEVFEKIRQYEPEIKELTLKFIKQYLFTLYEKGLLKGRKEGSSIRYNLSKITDPNKGYIDPELLSPGLD